MTKKSASNVTPTRSLKTEEQATGRSFISAENVVLNLSADTGPSNGKKNFLRNIFLVNRLLSNWQISIVNLPEPSEDTWTVIR